MFAGWVVATTMTAITTTSWSTVRAWSAAKRRMFGFDWVIHEGVQTAANVDMGIPIFTTEQADILRDRYDKVEAASGWKFNDILIGDDRLYRRERERSVAMSELPRVRCSSVTNAISLVAPALLVLTRSLPTT